MAKPPTTLDDIFNEIEAEAAASPRPAPLTPEQLAKREEENRAEHEKGIRLGWWDKDGNPLEQESDEDEDEDEEESK